MTVTTGLSGEKAPNEPQADTPHNETRSTRVAKLHAESKSNSSGKAATTKSKAATATATTPTPHLASP